MMNELVSIAMTTYNGEKYLQEQMESIINQTYKNWEIIICDDNSNDKTISILKEYASADSRIKIFENEVNIGFKRNFEKALKICGGNYIALADQDDIWEKEKIEILVNKIGNHDLIHSACSLIDEDSNEISPEWIKKDRFKYSFSTFVFGNTVTGCTVLFKRDLLKNFFPVPSGEKYHDWWLALLASKQNGIFYIRRKLVRYRQHQNQDTGALTEKLSQKLMNKFPNCFIKNNIKAETARNQIIRLQSILNEKEYIFSVSEITIIKDALNYYTDYLYNFFHFRKVLIGLKYWKETHYQNYVFVIKLIKTGLLKQE
jgi:glycosyltransferase involved in cell wall biosynthesis